MSDKYIINNVEYKLTAVNTSPTCDRAVSHIVAEATNYSTAKDYIGTICLSETKLSSLDDLFTLLSECLEKQSRGIFCADNSRHHVVACKIVYTKSVDNYTISIDIDAGLLHDNFRVQLNCISVDIIYRDTVQLNCISVDDIDTKSPLVRSNNQRIKIHEKQQRIDNLERNVEKLTKFVETYRQVLKLLTFDFVSSVGSRPNKFTGLLYINPKVIKYYYTYNDGETNITQDETIEVSSALDRYEIASAFDVKNAFITIDSNDNIRYCLAWKNVEEIILAGQICSAIIDTLVSIPTLKYLRLYSYLSDDIIRVDIPKLKQLKSLKTIEVDRHNNTSLFNSIFINTDVKITFT